MELSDKVFDSFVVCPTTACWLWAGPLNKAGYAMFWSPRRRREYAHRYVYEACVAPIPEGLELDHVCRVRNCVNPAHLEPVTGAENKRRSRAARGVGQPGVPKAEYRKRSRCECGSEFKVTPSGRRWCPPCRSAYQAEYLKDPAKKAHRAAIQREYHQKRKAAAVVQ